MKRKRLWRGVTFVSAVLLSITVCIAEIQAENVHHDYTMEELKEIEENAISWRRQNQKNFLKESGNTTADWFIIALGSLGAQAEYEDYLAVIQDRVQKRYRTEERLDANKATEWHRIALAMLAAGGNPEQAGFDKAGNPINLIADGIYDRGETVPLDTQGINGYLWGLLTLDANHYEIPEGAVDNRESIIDGILSYELPEGGFALSRTDTKPDIDITAMTLQALSPYWKDTNYPEVKDAVMRSVELLSQKQTTDGDFFSYGSQNLESTAQVMIALCCLGIDPISDKRFIKENHTILDGIMKYHQEDGGFLHSFDYDEDNPTANPEESNQMAGEQAMISICALMRYYRGYASVYDFTAENRKDVLNGAEAVSTHIRITKEDIAEYEDMPKQLTTEYEISVICLLDKLEKADNGADYEYLQPQLLEKKKQIEGIQEQIESLNQRILQELYPYQELRIGDEKQITEIVEQFEQLSEYDRQQVAGYEDIMRAYHKVLTIKRTMMITIAIVLIIGVMLTAWILQAGKRRREKYEEEHWYEME